MRLNPKILCVACMLLCIGNLQAVGVDCIFHEERQAECFSMMSDAISREVLEISNERELKRCGDMLAYSEGKDFLSKIRGLVIEFEVFHCSEACLRMVSTLISNSPNLENLRIYNTRVPLDEILELQNLKSLYIGRSQLSELPKEIENLKKLELLDLSYNKLVQLPEEIGELESLKYLCVDNNKLQDLPEEINKLSNLDFISIYNNKFKKFPEVLLLRQQPVDVQIDGAQASMLGRICPSLESADTVVSYEPKSISVRLPLKN